MKNFKNCIKILIILSFFACSSGGGSDVGQVLLLNTLLKKENKKVCSELLPQKKYTETAENQRKNYVPNEIIMPYEYGCIKIHYGNDVKCTEHEGKYGTSSGTNQCAINGKTTKIAYVQTVIKTYINKMKAQGIDIAPTLISNAPTLYMFNNITDKNKATDYLNETGKGQDLQADETFVLKDSAHGIIKKANGKDARNAAMEEIIHLLHNYGISKVKPFWQFKLDLRMNNALTAKQLEWTDADGNGIGDDENKLPKKDLDDEFFADGVEAYFNVRGGDGYIKTDVICSYRSDSPKKCTSSNDSRTMLKNNLNPLYGSVQEILGTSTTFYP